MTKNVILPSVLGMVIVGVNYAYMFVSSLHILMQVGLGKTSRSIHPN